MVCATRLNNRIDGNVADDYRYEGRTAVVACSGSYPDPNEGRAINAEWSEVSPIGAYCPRIARLSSDPLSTPGQASNDGVGGKFHCVTYTDHLLQWTDREMRNGGS
ncbi:hypothetical protein ALP10_200094 [Pseudomonas syringae pv. helianthi]|uniref:Uncharacterized protein n=1 Tax=Pseudomonas syringae pv. helianthi TaxID=251654 RepID=A0A3M6CQT0_9PSED|nr:hypothetical protein ALP10_200094 [Pseudomonas syringae pv. helianthi]